MASTRADLEQELRFRQQPYDGTLLLIKLSGATRDQSNADFILRSAYPGCLATEFKEGDFVLPSKTSRVIFCGSLPTPEMYEHCEAKHQLFVLHDSWDSVLPDFIKKKHLLQDSSLVKAAQKYLDLYQPDWRARFSFDWMKYWDYHATNYAGLSEGEAERASNIVFGLIERNQRADDLRDHWGTVEEERMEKIGKGPIGQRTRREIQRTVANAIPCEADLAGNRRNGKLFREALDYPESLARAVANFVYKTYGDEYFLVILLGTDYTVQGSDEKKKLYKNMLIFAKRVDFTKGHGYVSGEDDLARFLFEDGEDDLSRWLEYDRERTC